MRTVEHQEPGQDPRWVILALAELMPQTREMFGKLGQVTRLASAPEDGNYALIYLTLPNSPCDRSVRDGTVKITEGGEFQIPATETCGIKLEIRIDRIPNPGETRVSLTVLMGGWVTTDPKQSTIHLRVLEQAMREGVFILGTHRWEKA